MQSPDPRRIARTIERWFERYQRPLPWRDSYDPYHVWISEIMLQQTRMEVVLPYFASFITRFPTVATLASAGEDEVMAQWSGLGYYRRARTLHDAARLIQARFGGEIPSDVEALTSIPGIGRYTAGAIASIAWNCRTPLVDGNIARILSRVCGIEAAAGSSVLMRHAWILAGRCVEACSNARAFNQGLMELGALICRPRNPRCRSCPIRAGCLAFQTGRQETLPYPKPQQATRHLSVPLYLIVDAMGNVLMRRERGNLMKAMYHLPHGATSLLPASPLNARAHEKLGTFRHSITNRRVVFSVYRAGLTGEVSEGEFEWIDPEHMAGVPHPSYVAKALRIAGLGREPTRHPLSG